MAAEPETLGVISGMVLVLGGVAEIIRRSHMSKLNGVGRRVNSLERECVSKGDFDRFRLASEEDRQRLWEARGGDHQKIESVEKMIAGQHADIMSAIWASGEKQVHALHELELRVERQAAQGDVVKVLQETLGQIAQIMRENHKRGD